MDSSATPPPTSTHANPRRPWLTRLLVGLGVIVVTAGVSAAVTAHLIEANRPPVVAAPNPAFADLQVIKGSAVVKGNEFVNLPDCTDVITMKLVMDGVDTSYLAKPLFGDSIVKVKSLKQVGRLDAVKLDKDKNDSTAFRLNCHAFVNASTDSGFYNFGFNYTVEDGKVTKLVFRIKADDSEWRNTISVTN